MLNGCYSEISVYSSFMGFVVYFVEYLIVDGFEIEIEF